MAAHPTCAARRLGVNARTVLARKGTLTPRRSGAPLRAPRRSGKINIATGGSGGMSFEAILLESIPESQLTPAGAFTQNRGHYRPMEPG